MQNGAVPSSPTTYKISSAGGYAMSGGAYTVALAPRDKVDYSVTKGGLRLWAVVFVFIVLCSSLYTVFSAREIFDIAVGMFPMGIPIEGRRANNQFVLRRALAQTEAYFYEKAARHALLAYMCSMGLGGLRVPIVHSNEDSHCYLEADGDLDGDVDDGDDEETLHAQKRLEKEREVKETPSRSPGEKLSVPDRNQLQRSKGMILK